MSGLSKNVLYSGLGLGSYYYDAFGELCPFETVQYPENLGIASCESYFTGPNQIPLKDHSSNNLIAIDNTLLQEPGGREKFCGKRVIVRYNGVLINQVFVVWDGCTACLDGARLDFSRSALVDIDPEACNLGLLQGISWNVIDEQVMEFVH
jgi:hypothetical protein